MIIGRGVIALTGAFELLKRGFDVTLFGPKETRGVASYAAVGISSIKGLRVARDDFFREKLSGHRRFLKFIKNIEQHAGVKVPTVNGVGEYFSSLQDYQQLRERTYHGEFTGLFEAEIQSSINVGKYHLLSQHLKKRPISGLFYYPDDLWFDPCAFLQSLELAIIKLGGRIVDDYAEKIALYREKEFKVVGKLGSLCTENLVLACGPTVPKLMVDLTKVKLPFLTVSGQTLIANGHSKARETFRIGRKALSLYGEKLRYGSMDFPKNHTPSKSDIESTQVKLLNELRSDFSLDVANAKSLWGTRLALKDRRPVIGKLPCEGDRGLWISCGYHKSGFSLAELSSKVLAELLENQLENNGQFYSVSRFYRSP